jgi:CO/xanthine dehydrogenase Mo-binding subunit
MEAGHGMKLISVCQALADAFHDATGVWLRELPYTPERVQSALQLL